MPDAETPPNAKQLMLDLIDEINKDRASAKNSTYAPYTFNLTLTKAALNHCKWMAENASTSHTGLNNSTPGERVTEAGFIHTMVAENNVAGIQLQTARQAVDAWRRSPSHNPNISSEECRRVITRHRFPPKSKSVRPVFCRSMKKLRSLTGVLFLLKGWCKVRLLAHENRGGLARSL